jgi:uroporphyrinogen decarboxylase
MERMSPKQRWRALFEGRKLDRSVSDYWGTAEVTNRLVAELGCSSEQALWEKLGVDRMARVSAKHPKATEDTWYLQSQYSVWGIGTREVSYGAGAGTYIESVGHPLANARLVSDLDSYAWPDPDHFAIHNLRPDCHRWDGYPIMLGSYEPFLLYCRLRGMEAAFGDLLERPAFAEAVLDRIHDIHHRLLRRCLAEAADLIDFLYVGEDLGTQESLLMSPVLFRRFIKPRLRNMIDLAHSFGVRAFHHDDGAIRRLIPELLEIGIDVLNPIQWRCRGMEREGLARDFGSQVVLHGGIDNQNTLPFGTPDQVRREVRETMRIFQASRGYIVAPCHNIQPNTPTANILALYDAVRDFGTGGK